MMKHWQLDLAGIPRNLKGKRLTLAEREALYEEGKQREVRRAKLAAETGTSPKLWK